MHTPTACAALLLAPLALTHAVPVTGWVATNGDAGFAGGSEATNSPVTTDADAETIVGSFPSTTLAIGESLVLTGTITITGNTGTVPGNQLRWGLFDAPGVPTTGSGAGYVGVWASASSNIDSADGSTSNPFSGSASTTIVSSSGALPQFGNPYKFSLTVSRLDATQMEVSGSLANAGGGSPLISWTETAAAASPAGFTYDAVGILLGGTTDATSAAFSDIDVAGILPPADSDGDGMPDDYEDANGLDRELDDAGLDLDGDTLTNIAEYRGADGTPGTGDETRPNDGDSDDDDSRDDHELARGTDPNNPDTDGDALLDGVETGGGTFVGPSDTGTDPLLGDTDGDSVADGLEVAAGTDPNDPESRLGARLFGVDFNRGDHPGAPTYSGLRVVSGSATQAENPGSVTKQIGGVAVTLATGDASALEFRGANGDPDRAIPGGDISKSFLVADFAASRSGDLAVTLQGLPAGDYVWVSYHLDPITTAGLGFAGGLSSTTPNTIEARLDGSLLASTTPTALGAAGLNTTSIADSDVPSLVFPISHDGGLPVTVELTATDSDGTDRHLLINGFEIFPASPAP